jgi:U4/U6.U5 tri-snRNP-associated protein 1
MNILQVLYYSAKLIVEHLKGLKVGHDVDDFEAGEGMILTIKDRGVLDEDGGSIIFDILIIDEGDELISTALAEKERLKENLGNKIRKPKYDPYAEEYDEDTGEKKLLSKYDEETKKKVFILDEPG